MCSLDFFQVAAALFIFLFILLRFLAFVFLKGLTTLCGLELAWMTVAAQPDPAYSHP